jgi:hypothetical protein
MPGTFVLLDDTLEQAGGGIRGASCAAGPGADEAMADAARGWARRSPTEVDEVLVEGGVRLVRSRAAKAAPRGARTPFETTFLRWWRRLPDRPSRPCAYRCEGTSVKFNLAVDSPPSRRPSRATGSSRITAASLRST